MMIRRLREDIPWHSGRTWGGLTHDKSALMPHALSWDLDTLLLRREVSTARHLSEGQAESADPPSKAKEEVYNTWFNN